MRKDNSYAIKQIYAWLPVLLWALLIFRFSSGIVPVASTVLWQDFAVKKTGHVLLFGTMAALIYRALIMNKVSKIESAMYAVVLSMFYGATDEFHQMFTQGRESRIRDVFIDGLGAFIAILIIYKFFEKLPKKLQTFLLELGFK